MSSQQRATGIGLAQQNILGLMPDMRLESYWTKARSYTGQMLVHHLIVSVYCLQFVDMYIC